MAADQQAGCPRRRLSAVVDLLGVLTTLVGCFGAHQVYVLGLDGPWRPAAPHGDGAPLVFRAWRLNGPLEAFRAAVDVLQADDVPELYWRKVQASRARRCEHAARREQARRRP